MKDKVLMWLIQKHFNLPDGCYYITKNSTSYERVFILSSNKK